MKSIFAVATLLLSCMAHAGQDVKPLETGPEAAAARFMAQVYSVKPSEIMVTTTKRDSHTASVTTEVPGQRTCSLDMAETPTLASAEFGWLIGGIACDRNATPAGFKG